MSNASINGLVSVVLPTHNRSKMLREAIKSILAQDYDKIELIIVQDACTDDTSTVLMEFKDPRIKSIISNTNLGGANARNLGIKSCKGEYIAFLDDDDVWKKNKLSSQLKIFKEFNDVAIVSTNYESINSFSSKQINLPNKILLNDLLYKNFCGSFSFCITKSKYLRNLTINPKLRACQDWDLWVKVLYNTGLKCRTCTDSLVVYNTAHDDRLSNHKRNIYESRVIFLRDKIGLMDKKQLYFNYYELIKMKRIENWVKYNYIIRLKLYIKALKYYHRAGFERSLYNYLLIITKIFNLS